MSVTEEVLRDIKEAFPDKKIHFFHLPQKREVKRGRYSIDWRETIEDLGVHYYPALHEYDWMLQHYFPKDNHPNAKGYSAISDYVAARLHLAESATANNARHTPSEGPATGTAR